MKRRKINSEQEAMARMSVLRGMMKGKKSALDDITVPWNKDRIRSEIGEIQERIEELERKWPRAAQKIS